MDYGDLLSRAWRITWQHPFLWVFGLFAGGLGGPGCGIPSTTFSWRDGRSSELESLLPNVNAAADAAGRWLLANLWIVAVAALLVLAVFLALLALSLVCQAALIHAGARLAGGEPTSWRDGWHAGLARFWRFLGLAGLLVAVALALALLVAGAVVLLVVVGGADRGQGGAIVLVLACLLVLVGLLVGIPLAIGATIVIAYALRAMVVDDLGVFAALGHAVHLLKTRLATSLVIWLIDLALQFGIGFGVLLAALVLAIPLGLIVGAAFLTLGPTLPTFVVAGIALLALILAVWALSGIANAFRSNYWTLAYLRLTGR